MGNRLQKTKSWMHGNSVKKSGLAGLPESELRFLVREVRDAVYAEQKETNRRHLETALNELAESMEHYYYGLWYCMAAAAMEEARHLSQRTILSVFRRIDELHGMLLDGRLTPSDIRQIAEEKAGIKVEFECGHREMVSRHEFESACLTEEKTEGNT